MAFLILSQVKQSLILRKHASLAKRRNRGIGFGQKSIETLKDNKKVLEKQENMRKMKKINEVHEFLPGRFMSI